MDGRISKTLCPSGGVGLCGSLDFALAVFYSLSGKSPFRVYVLFSDCLLGKCNSCSRFGWFRFCFCMILCIGLLCLVDMKIDLNLIESICWIVVKGYFGPEVDILGKGNIDNGHCCKFFQKSAFLLFET